MDDADGIADRATLSQGEAKADHDVLADGVHLGSCCTCCRQRYQAGFCVPTQLYSLPGRDAYDVDRARMQSEYGNVDDGQTADGRFKTRDITFASVHDSYWTHASSIDQMSEVIRDTFIALHSSDILRKLEAEVSMASHACFLDIHPPVRLVPRAVCEPLGTPVSDPEGIDTQDAPGRGLPYFGIQGRGCGTQARERSGW